MIYYFNAKPSSIIITYLIVVLFMISCTDSSKKNQPIEKYQINIDSTGRFIDNGDGTVTDNTTLLMWSKSPASQKMELSEAKDYAKNSLLGGHQGWRLPSSSELAGLGWNYPVPLFKIVNGEYVTDSESSVQAGCIYVIGIYWDGINPPKNRRVSEYYNGSKQYPFYVLMVREKETNNAK